MSVTPMMAQYLEIKDAHKDALLFYRMGDFYEMFFDDAVAAAEALDIALTKRGKHDGADIPMCGVPVHAAEGYLLTLIRKGFRVGVCEQLESPAEAKKRGSKSVVKRDVVRIVTPGTLTEETLLEARKHNFLAAFSVVRDESALAWADMSTGSVQVMSLPQTRLGAELARLSPAELIVSEANAQDLRYLEEDFGIALTDLPRSAFDSTAAETRLKDVYSVQSLDAFGQFSRAEVAALGAVVSYIDLTQKGNLPLLLPPKQEAQNRTVQIDAATRRNLELTQSMSGGRAGSLLSVIDMTATAPGARLLEQRLSSPSRDHDLIADRLDGVSYFVNHTALAEDLRSALRAVPDLERAISRLSLDRGGPRDLGAVRKALEQAGALSQLLAAQDDLPKSVSDPLTDLQGREHILDQLDEMLVAELPLHVRDGGFIAPGAHEELDEARTLRDEGRSVIASMQQKYQSLTDVSSLKIKHNNVLGYFVETTATHAERMMSAPLSDTFIHRQTTANQVRFTTVELSDLEARIQSAGDQAQGIEKALFEELRHLVVSMAAELHQTSRALAALDVLVALANLATRENWTRPIVDDSRSFDIVAGRHPVVEASLKRQSGDEFIANSCDLGGDGDAASIWLLTGPNMSGKSTFLRQNALIAILAQIGSYVPAERAHIGSVSQIFSRVGASDDLARGRSTFMVEMVETAAILNQSDDRALVILDEIGRGTSTYDGLSIAWATLEHLHDVNRCRALFATHYHELTVLAGKLDGVKNATVAVKEWEGDVIFLHEVREGSADRSYGVQVAKLAGLPKSVIARARTVLDALEKGSREGKANPSTIIDDLPLFSVAPSAAPTDASETSPVVELLEEIQPDDLSPRDALDLIYKLKAASKA
ncbi:DNA mismatch repair protein MutS [Aliishimia ponticola]|uniref:DNA mismatch repair protein MutS n=1 Tax=Aliishimia ponticola TaxID=2499833 RepID=A0A4S4N698_9RHOB|nr:DNA mismatch repair protein MutS [Aliishimia ponticola]THH34654.1 DNA mismatch repair protein MutS [Aliishimia ponticola]